MNKPTKTIFQKAQAEIPYFVEEVAGLSVDQIDARLAQLTKDLEAIQEQKEADDELLNAIALVTEYRGPYTEGKMVAKMKSKLLIAMAKEKGGN